PEIRDSDSRLPRRRFRLGQLIPRPDSAVIIATFFLCITGITPFSHSSLSLYLRSEAMLLALLLTLSMAAPGLTGVVKDTSGGAVPGASVTVQTTSGTDQHTVISGSDGRFTFEAVPDGAIL